MKFYISFGQVHTHSIGGRTIDKDCIVVLEADSRNAAHEMAHELFGPKFCFVNTESPNMNFYPRGLIRL